jgi:energy-coupling factor transport system ATP-binding protein
MEDYLNANPEELSGGQKQRVAIAGALAMETNLLIFDESTSMLDPKGTAEVNEMIKKIKDEHHKTIIVITHNVEEAAIADRVIVLNKGIIVADDTPQEVFKQSKLLKSCGLKTIDSIELLDSLRDKKYKNKKEIEELLWKSTFQK